MHTLVLSALMALALASPSPSLAATPDVDPLAEKGGTTTVLPPGVMDLCSFGQDSLVNFYIVTWFGYELCQSLEGEVIEVTPEDVHLYKPMFWL
jgi:hypothetical protein